MSTRVPRLIFMLMLMALALSACATGQMKTAEKQETLITGYAFSDGALTLAMNNPYSDSYTIYKPGDPFTAVVEIPGVGLGNVAASAASSKGGITEAKFTVINTPKLMTRVEVSMDSPSDLVAERTGNTLRLRVVKAEEPKAPAAEAAPAAPAQETAPAASAPAGEVTSIRFEPGAGDTLNLVIQGDGAITPQVYAMGGKVILDFPGIKMSAMVPMKAVPPVLGIRKGLYEGSPRLILDLDRDSRFDVASVGNSVVLTFKSSSAGRSAATASEAAEGTEVVTGTAAPTEELKAPHAKYTGKIISLDFQDADIVPIFRFIGEVAGLNVVIHPDVKGKITLKLLNVPWDQALDIILKLSGLGDSIDGNILTIAPTKVFTEQKEDARKLQEASAKAADIVQATVHLDYIEAADFQAKLKEASVFSDRGKSRIDPRTNTLIVNDTEDVINRIINEERPYWDTPEHGKLQVMIEARMVEVDSSLNRTLGVAWGGNATNDNFSFIHDASSYDVSVNTPVVPAGPNVNIGGPGGVLSIGYTETFKANLSIQALESVDEARSLANPKVLTMDGHAAKIEQGAQIPYQTVSSNGTQTQFVSATLSLEVTPEIQPNGIIKMKIKAKNDSPTTVQGASAPAINTQNVETSALIRDGETLVLGGIYKQKNEDTEGGIPYLHNIPFLGWLFKTRGTINNQTELLIFITPTIVNRTASR